MPIDIKDLTGADVQLIDALKEALKNDPKASSWTELMLEELTAYGPRRARAKAQKPSRTT